MDQDRALEPRASLELRQQSIDIVDVPGPFDLRDHHHVELVADLGHQRGDVVEHPRRLEAVDPRPQLRLAEVDVTTDAQQPLARCLLAIDRHGILEVAEQDVHRRRDVGHLRDHFLVGEVEEVDHPRWPERDLQHWRRCADREWFSEVAGVSHWVGLLVAWHRKLAGNGILLILGECNQEIKMTEVETDQAAREASGAHTYGRYLEEFEVGAVYKHWPAKTVTEADDHLFCLITMNHHPLHINDVYAKQSQQGRNVVVGPLVYSLALGMSVSDVSGKAIANLATEELKHPAPVFHGDTLFCESEVLEVKPSQSKPDRGVVRVHTRVLNQDGVLVAEFKRLVLVPRKEPGAPLSQAETNVE